MSYDPTYFDQLPASRVLNKRKGVEPYVFNDDMVIAVDVALATKRPLLVSGNPGSGKSRLADAIAAGGSSLRDYVHTDGELGYFQHTFKVYDREGEVCRKPQCGGTIRRIVQSGRSTFYCPACQR